MNVVLVKSRYSRNYSLLTDLQNDLWVLLIDVVKHEFVKFHLLNRHVINCTVWFHGGKAPHILQVSHRSEPFRYVTAAVDRCKDSQSLLRNIYQVFFYCTYCMC
jgi:hypothetical protein